MFPDTRPKYDGETNSLKILSFNFTNVHRRIIDHLRLDLVETFFRESKSEKSPRLSNSSQFILMCYFVTCVVMRILSQLSLVPISTYVSKSIIFLYFLL